MSVAKLQHIVLQALGQLTTFLTSWGVLLNSHSFYISGKPAAVEEHAYVAVNLVGMCSRFST